MKVDAYAAGGEMLEYWLVGSAGPDAVIGNAEE